MDLDLSGKTILVSGGSKGLGFGIARQCGLEGASLVLGSREEDNLASAKSQLHGEGIQQVHTTHLDVNQPESIDKSIASALSQTGRLDGLVVNAGGPPPGMFDDLDDQAWQQAFELTLMSAVRLIRACLPTMREQGGGSILVLTSSSVKEPIDYLLLSNVMRSGVTSLAKSLSRSLAAENIRVNNLVPGLIGTDRMKNLDELQAEVKGIAADEQTALNEALIPMGRYGTPDEFGRIGAFLLSSAASYMTGATVIADGGTMRTVW